MPTSSKNRPVIGATCLGPGTPHATSQLRLIAGLGMTMCETILNRGDTSPERRDAVLQFLDEAEKLGVAVLLETQFEPDLEANPTVRNVPIRPRSDSPSIGLCYRNPIYLDAADEFTGEVCRLYLLHPATLRVNGRPVLAIGHEMQYLCGNDSDDWSRLSMTCYCPTCIKAFRTWLRARYSDSVEGYNRRHTRRIGSFHRVNPPRRPESDRLVWQEWLDFHAEAIPEAIARQRAVIEREVPDALVTHEINDWYPNTWRCVYTGNHFWKMGGVLEHAFNDQYPMEWDPGSLWRIYLYTFTQDVTQSAIGFEKSFWCNGQAFSSWQGDFADPPEEGYVEQVYSALIHGANGLIWWTGGDLVRGTKTANEEYLRLVEILGDARPMKDPVAFLVPWTTYAQTRSPDRGDDLMSGYQLLNRLGYQVEAVDEGQIEGGILRERGYRALFIWGNSSLLPAAREKIERFVREGGIVFADFGDLDTQPFGTVFPETIREGKTPPSLYVLPDGTRIPVRARSQVLRRRKGYEVISRYSDGSPAIVRYPYGKGVLWRAGTLIGVDYAAGMGLYDWVHQERVRIEPALESLVGAELAEHGILPRARANNPNVEAGLFSLDGRTMAVLVNHLRHPVHVAVQAHVAVQVRVPAAGSPHAQDVFTEEDVGCTLSGGVVELTVHLKAMGGRAIWLEVDR